jgi:CBS domain-containing protein
VAARRAQYDVGTIVVMDVRSPDHPAGLVTDRDIAVRCVAEGLNPDETPVARLMTSPAQTIDEGTPVEDATRRMASAGTRRLVVTDASGRAVGILSLDDVLDVVVEETGAIGRLLHKQQPHVVG